ncbi:hypothetical protein ACHWQZ_G010094 [Mnemiopsis leidyi]
MSEGTSVTVGEAEAKDSKFTLYKVVLQKQNGAKWYVLRRYKEFYDLYQTLRSSYPQEMSNIKLPGKKVFGNFDPAFIKQRAEGLNDFGSLLFENDKLKSCKEVQRFFGIDKQPVDADNSVGFNADDSVTPELDDGINLGTSHNKSVKYTDFEMIRFIGKGSFGKVILAKHKETGKHYALKVLEKRLIIVKNEAKHIMAERNVLIRNVKHPFLVGLKYSFKTRDKLFFVLDYVNGGELFFHLQRERTFHESRARFYAAEIASAIGYLHSINIIYRDLKPENILLDREGHIVLTDFGLCKEGIALNKTTNTFCGTPEYLAPEVIQKQPYTNAVDWWCLGAVLYEMIFGLPPFYSKDTRQMYENILYQQLRFKTHVSLHARKLLEGLLQKQTNNRLGSSSRDVMEIKEHPFFSSIDWELLEKKQITPPYDPNVKDNLDLKHFSTEFTTQNVPDSLVKSPDKLSVSVTDPDDEFTGFTYVTRSYESDD